MATFSKLLPYQKIRTSIRIIIFEVCIRISVIICCYLNTIDDKRNEMDFFYHYNEFVYNYDYVIFLRKSDDALLVYEDLYEKDYYNFLLF